MSLKVVSRNQYDSGIIFDPEGEKKIQLLGIFKQALLIYVDFDKQITIQSTGEKPFKYKYPPPFGKSEIKCRAISENLFVIHFFQRRTLSERFVCKYEADKSFAFYRYSIGDTLPGVPVPGCYDGRLLFCGRNALNIFEVEKKIDSRKIVLKQTIGLNSETRIFSSFVSTSFGSACLMRSTIGDENFSSYFIYLFPSVPLESKQDFQIAQLDKSKVKSSECFSASIVQQHVYLMGYSLNLKEASQSAQVCNTIDIYKFAIETSRKYEGAFRKVERISKIYNIPCRASTIGYEKLKSLQLVDSKHSRKKSIFSFFSDTLGWIVVYTSFKKQENYKFCLHDKAIKVQLINYGYLTWEIRSPQEFKCTRHLLWQGKTRFTRKTGLTIPSGFTWYETCWKETYLLSNSKKEYLALDFNNKVITTLQGPQYLNIEGNLLIHEDNIAYMKVESSTGMIDVCIKKIGEVIKSISSNSSSKRQHMQILPQPTPVQWNSNNLQVKPTNFGFETEERQPIKWPDSKIFDVPESFVSFTDLSEADLSLDFNFPQDELDEAEISHS